MNQVYEKDGYILRLARKEDAEEYYENNFQPFDPETARLTGSRTDFTHDEVVGFLKKCIDDKDRYDFLIFSPQGKIIGESVLNEIDRELRKPISGSLFSSTGLRKRDRILGHEKHSGLCFTGIEAPPGGTGCFFF